MPANSAEDRPFLVTTRFQPFRIAAKASPNVTLGHTDGLTRFAESRPWPFVNLRKSVAWHIADGNCVVAPTAGKQLETASGPHAMDMECSVYRARNTMYSDATYIPYNHRMANFDG